MSSSIDARVFPRKRLSGCGSWVKARGIPGRVIADLKIPLPHPRQRKSHLFLELIDHVYTTMAGQTQPEHVEFGSRPGETGHIRPLPEIQINVLTGLLEHVDEFPGKRIDI